MTRKPAAVLLVLSLAVLALALIPAAGLAAKGGNSDNPNRGGGNGGGGGGSAATISFNPSPVVVGQQYQVNGSGFRANTWVTVGAHYSDTLWWNSGVTDDQGNVSLTFTATSAGQVYHEAQQMGNNDRLRLATSATLTVTS